MLAAGVTGFSELSVRSQGASGGAAPFISSRSLATPQVRYAAASSKTRPVTAGARGIPSIRSGFFCAPGVIGSRSVNKNDSAQPSRRMRHTISVEVAYRCAQHVRDVFHQATPAQGRHLVARLVERLPTCPIPEIARLGRTLRTWKDAFLAYFDTAGASNAPPEATAAPPTSNSECSSSQEASTPPPPHPRPRASEHGGCEEPHTCHRTPRVPRPPPHPNADAPMRAHPCGKPGFSRRNSLLA